MQLTYFYAIHCPFTNHIVYIGRTIDPVRRLSAHLCATNSLVGRWCMLIRLTGKVPYMTIIGSTELSAGYTVNEIENNYINYYRKLNQADHNRDHRGRISPVSLYYKKPIWLERQDEKSIEIIISQQHAQL